VPDSAATIHQSTMAATMTTVKTAASTNKFLPLRVNLLTRSGYSLGNWFRASDVDR
jgi:hypothetical protein